MKRTLITEMIALHQLKICGLCQHSNVYAKFRCAAPCAKKALGIFRELITRRRGTTRVAFWYPPSGSKNVKTVSMVYVYWRQMQTAGAATAKHPGTSCHAKSTNKIWRTQFFLCPWWPVFWEK